MKEFGNPLYRPEGEKFEFGYSITTHLSQGSQYLTGIYLQEFFGGGPDIRKRLNYTGITRFRNKCIFVIPPLGVYVPILKSVVSINGRSV
jgi:ATP-dependent exoDNAse (exonuclease V) alpha subunit